MTDEEKQQEAEKKLAEEKAKEELKLKSVEELTELLHSTRSEAKQRRLKERDLEAEIAEMKAAQQKIDDDKLIADGKTKELLEAKILELTNTQTELEKIKIVAEESTTFKAAQVEIYKKQMGSKWLDEYANLSLTTLHTLVNNAVPVKVGTDNGADGDKLKYELTADQKREAIAKYPHIDEKKAYEYHTDNLIKSGKIKEK